MGREKKYRVGYAFAVIAVIFIGLGSRQLSCLPDATGDALWAMMVFCLVRLLFVRCSLWRVALAALLISYVVEFSQLIRWDVLVKIRATTLGHLVLGQGFLVSDLFAYTVGVAVIYGLAKRVER